MTQGELTATARRMGFMDVNHAERVLVPEAPGERPEEADAFAEEGEAIARAGHGRAPLRRGCYSELHAEGGHRGVAPHTLSTGQAILACMKGDQKR